MVSEDRTIAAVGAPTRDRGTIGQLLAGGVAAWRRDAADWALSGRAALTLFLLPLLPSALILGSASFRPVYRWLTEEDGPVEWVEFTFLFVGLSLLARCAALLWRRRQRAIAALYALVALGTLFVAGEEVSWGQRIFGWATPTGYAAANDQGETTLHNLGLARTFFILALLACGLYGVIAPLLRTLPWSGWQKFPRAYLLVPPLCLVPAFLPTVGYRLLRFAFFPDPRFFVVKLGELPEWCLYYGLLAFAALTLRRLRRAAPGQTP